MTEEILWTIPLTRPVIQIAAARRQLEVEPISTIRLCVGVQQTITVKIHGHSNPQTEGLKEIWLANYFLEHA